MCYPLLNLFQVKYGSLRKLRGRINMENPLVKAMIWGAVLAVGGIGLFFVMYFLVLSGADSLMRLIGSLCIPPAVMLLLVGGYYILTQNSD